MTIIVMALSVFILMSNGTTRHDVLSSSEAFKNTIEGCEEAKLFIEAQLAEAKSAGRVSAFDLVCVPLDVTALFRGA